MGKQNLHPTIQEFKVFVKRHPKLIQEVRTGKTTWQELYEDWYLLGEQDDTWKKYRTDGIEEESTEKVTSKSDLVAKLLSSIKNVKMNDVQKQISNVGSAITTIQQVIQQLQGGNQSGQTQSSSSSQTNPFAFRKD